MNHDRSSHCRAMNSAKVVEGTCIVECELKHPAVHRSVVEKRSRISSTNHAACDTVHVAAHPGPGNRGSLGDHDIGRTEEIVLNRNCIRVVSWIWIHHAVISVASDVH